jgi:hypothetical protein
MKTDIKKFLILQATSLHVCGAPQYSTTECLEIFNPNYGCEILHADDDYQQLGYSQKKF